MIRGIEQQMLQLGWGKYLATRIKSPCCRLGSMESPCTVLMPTRLSDTATRTGSVNTNPVEKLRRAERTPAID